MKKVLVIEDEKDLSCVLRQHLENHNFEVVEAHDGEEGLKAVAQEQPDLIMLDIKLPKVDGYTFIQELRANKDAAKTPVIVLSAYSNFDSLFRVENIAGYFTKPYDFTEILKVINHHFKNS